MRRRRRMFGKLFVEPYVANPVNLDGTNDSLTKTGGLTDAADGKVGALSLWFRDNTGGASANYIFSHQSRHAISFDASDVLRIIFAQSSGAGVLNVSLAGGAFRDGEWHHLFATWDLTNSSNRAFYVDGTARSPTWGTYSNTNIQYSSTNAIFIGELFGGLQRWNGDFADFYLNQAAYLNPATYLSSFISGAGKPVDLGEDGSLPTGSAPIIFLSGPTDAWHTNKGTGGGFTETGALTDGTGPVEL